MTDAAKHLMDITYKGAVRSSYGDEVVIAFETEDDIIEHTYVRSQFIDKKLPEVETRVVIHLSLVEDKEEPIEELGEDDLIDLRVHRKNLTEGDDTF